MDKQSCRRIAAQIKYTDGWKEDGGIDEDINGQSSVLWMKDEKQIHPSIMNKLKEAYSR